VPHIADAAEARKLREKLLEGGKTWHERLVKWRRLLDRAMTDELVALGASLPEKLREKWDPYQAADADDEVENLAALLASNKPDLEIIGRRADQSIVRDLQRLEDALTAFYDHKWPIELRIDRYRGILADGLAIHAWDKLPPGPAVAQYADRAALQAYAEADQETEAPESPKGRYRAAYQAAKGDTPAERHRAAYTAVTNQALAQDGVRWRHRLVDPETFYPFLDDDVVPDVIEGMEDKIIETNPALEALSGYGVEKRGTELVLTQVGDPALGGESAPRDFSGAGAVALGESGKVRYTQIRTRDEIVVLVQGLQSDGKTVNAEGGEIFIRVPSPFPAGNRRTGYYIVPGRSKRRGTLAQRFEPVILPLLVEQQIFNEVETARLAMAWAEASREEFELDAQAGPPPYDATQERKATGVDVNAPKGRPLASGEVKRVETTGIDIAAMARDHAERMAAFRSKEFFSGSGSASESGRHLADTQTAQLSKLVPIQTKCATVDKRMLMDILSVHAATGEPLFVPVMPSTPKAERGDTIQLAEPLEITADMARLPFEVRIEIGADVPQAQWARQQVSREEVAFGTYGISEHREIVKVRNPQETVRRMAVDSIVRAVLGTDQQPGLATARVIDLVNQRAQQIVDALLPPPPAELQPPPPGGTPMPGPAGQPIGAPGAEGTAGTPAAGSGAGGVYVPPAVAGGAGGVPDVAGAHVQVV